MQQPNLNLVNQMHSERVNPNGAIQQARHNESSAEIQVQERTLVRNQQANEFLNPGVTGDVQFQINRQMQNNFETDSMNRLQ